MNLEGITLSEISQTEKDKYCMISLMCGIQKPPNSDLWFPEVGRIGGQGRGELEEGGQKVKTSSYKISNY